MKKLTSIVLGMFVFTGIAAEQKFEKPEQFEKNAGLKCTPEANRISGANRLLGSEFIAVDPEAVYILRITARKVPGSPEFYAHAGFLLYDESMTELKPYFYRAEYNTESILLEPISKGNKTVKIRKPHWFPEDVVRRAWFLALDTKTDKSDIPNRNVNSVAKYELADDNTVILTLRTGVGKSYPVGTGIRFHSSGPAGMYPLFNGVKLTEEFQNYHAVIKGMSGGQHLNKFWKGAAFMKLVISNSPASGDRNIAFEFKDLTLTVE